MWPQVSDSGRFLGLAGSYRAQYVFCLRYINHFLSKYMCLSTCLTPSFFFNKFLGPSVVGVWLLQRLVQIPKNSKKSNIIGWYEQNMFSFLPIGHRDDRMGVLGSKNACHVPPGWVLKKGLQISVCRISVLKDRLTVERLIGHPLCHITSQLFPLSCS